MTMENDIIFARPTNLLAIAGGNLVAPPAALLGGVGHWIPPSAISVEHSGNSFRLNSCMSIPHRLQNRSAPALSVCRRIERGQRIFPLLKSTVHSSMYTFHGVVLCVQRWSYDPLFILIASASPRSTGHSRRDLRQDIGSHQSHIASLWHAEPLCQVSCTPACHRQVHRLQVALRQELTTCALGVDWYELARQLQ